MNERSAQRLATLEEALTHGGALHLRDAAELCGVSEMTIRRDLAAHPSAIHLLGGRLVLSGYPGTTPVYDLNEQEGNLLAVKQQLCQRVASYIEEGDTLFIDCGSTLIPLLGQLGAFRELTVVTYALNVANAVAALPNVRLVMLGGLFYSASQSFGGAGISESIERLGINKALISAAGVDCRHRVSCFHFHEVAPKKAAINAAMQRILVVDASKFGVVRPAFFATLCDFDVVVTDNAIPSELLDQQPLPTPVVSMA